MPPSDRPAGPRSLAFLAMAAMLAIAGCWNGQAPVARQLDEPPPAWSPKPLDLTELAFKYPDHNLVLVSFDALQAAHVGCLGYTRNVTPCLDELAADSFTFTRNHSVASWTVPATMTWFTGVYPSEHRLTNKFAVYTADQRQPANLRQLAPNLTTLAEILRERGYATGGFTGNAGVSGSFGFDQGFDVYDHEPQRFGTFEKSIPKALAWLAANKDRKFFLFLHGYDVHGQSGPAAGLDYRFVSADYDHKYSGSPREQEILREEGLDRGQLVLRDDDVRFWRAIYDEKIQRADARFRQFLAELWQLGLEQKTLVVITSDHGTELYEHQRFDHGFTLYQEQVHVPLFIKLPGQRGGAAIDQRVSSIDLMPTLLDLLDIPLAENVRPQLRGQSLVPVMQGQAAARDVFSETDYRQYTYKRSIVSPAGFKLIYTLESRSRELFDLNLDPHEKHDLSRGQPQLADELQERLFAHFRSIGHDLASQQWEVGLNPVYDSQTKQPQN